MDDDKRIPNTKSSGMTDVPGYVLDTLIGQAAFFSTAIHSVVKKIRFNNNIEETKGLDLLLTSSYDVFCYKDDVYGLVSEEQVRLLDKSGAQYSIY